jgi:hypothetical protein
MASTAGPMASPTRCSRTAAMALSFTDVRRVRLHF